LDGRPLGYGKPDLRNPAIITIGDTRLDWPALLREGGASQLKASGLSAGGGF
jgi:hypothetical protein